VRMSEPWPSAEAALTREPSQPWQIKRVWLRGPFLVEQSSNRLDLWFEPNDDNKFVQAPVVESQTKAKVTRIFGR
jgi:hypothetical protein